MVAGQDVIRRINKGSSIDSIKYLKEARLFQRKAIFI